MNTAIANSYPYIYLKLFWSLQTLLNHARSEASTGPISVSSWISIDLVRI